LNWLGRVVESVLTPALIASFISLLFNHRAEKHRAERDFITKTFDAARDDVRRCVGYGIEYFPNAAHDRTPAIEAKLWMGERDVRSSVAGLIEFSKHGSRSQQLLQQALDDFIDALTGGSFQSATATADLDQVRKVASTGAILRAAISTARQLELREAISSDILSRSASAAVTYLNENLGPEDKQTRVIRWIRPRRRKKSGRRAKEISRFGRQREPNVALAGDGALSCIQPRRPCAAPQ
jgi:hypothetical protein